MLHFPPSLLSPDSRLALLPAVLLSALLMSAVLLSVQLQAAEPPALRIASMNLCSDQLLLLLVPRERIVSLSYLAADPDYSPVASQTAGLHLNHGQAEELLPLAPDLILSGQFSAALATNLLERLGLPVLRLGVATSPADIYAQLETVAQHTGTEPLAQQLIIDMQANVAAQTSNLRPLLQGKSAVFYSSNGFTYGSNTLQDAFLQSLGLRNAASGLQGPAQLSLEALLRAQPDYLFINTPDKLDRQLAHPLLQHPALAALRDLQVIEVPDQYFECASPLYLQAYAALARQL